MVTRKYEGDFILASYLLNAKVSWPSDNVCCNSLLKLNYDQHERESVYVYKEQIKLIC